jgi:hypothetical protein
VRHFGGDRCRRNPRLDQIESKEAGEEVRSAMEWARVRALEADGVSRREIARLLGINPRTVKRLAESGEPPGYRRQPAGSMLDPLERVIRKLIKDWPDIKAPRVTEPLRTISATRARSTW